MKLRNFDLGEHIDSERIAATEWASKDTLKHFVMDGLSGEMAHTPVLAAIMKGLSQMSNLKKLEMLGIFDCIYDQYRKAVFT